MGFGKESIPHTHDEPASIAFGRKWSYLGIALPRKAKGKK